ncbi:MAG: glycosyltransferase family 9 protein [Alphaproteobacteria bacterium]|nr:glycosyltransferase family 9 protein [Alphaproteobacteria bacterium]
MTADAAGTDAFDDRIGRDLSAAAFRVSAFWRLLPSGMRRRWRFFRFLDALARHWPVFAEKRGALVVRMDGIGDMVLFRAALDHYAAALGLDKSEITVLGCDSWKEIAPQVFAGYRVVTINEHRYARRPFYRLKISLMARRLNARTAIVDSFFRRALMADALAYVSAAPTVVSSHPYVSEKTRAEYRYYLSFAGRVIDTGAYPDHEIIRHFRFVSALAGRAIEPRAPRMTWTPSGDLSRFGVAGRYALFNPGANEPGRRWPLVSTIALAHWLLDKGLSCVFVGLAGHKAEEPELARLLKMPGVIDLRGKTDLPGLMDLMQGAALVLSNDSGPAHLAIAIGAPTVVFAGGGHAGCFVPYPESLRPANARFLAAPMDCYHCFWACHKRAGRNESFPCVAAIPVEAAAAAADELLAAGERTP